jgi:hypothetical protein
MIVLALKTDKRNRAMTVVAFPTPPAIPAWQQALHAAYWDRRNWRTSRTDDWHGWVGKYVVTLQRCQADG